MRFLAYLLTALLCQTIASFNITFFWMGVLANLQAKVVKLADKTLCTCNSVIIATNFTKLSLVKSMCGCTRKLWLSTANCK